MTLRPLALLPVIGVLAACAGGPVGSPSAGPLLGPTGGPAPGTVGSTGTNSPVLATIGPSSYRDATMANAPFTLGRTDLLAGDPLRAVGVALDLERMTYAAEVDPFWQTARDSLLQPVLQIGRRQMREAIGIPDRASPELVIPALTTAGEALSRNDRARASTALAGIGRPDTLDRLSNLPRLRRVEEAGQRAGQEFNRAGRERG